MAGIWQEVNNDDAEQKIAGVYLVLDRVLIRLPAGHGKALTSISAPEPEV